MGAPVAAQPVASRLELAIQLAASADVTSTMFGGVRVTMMSDGTETVEELSMHEAIALALRTIHLYHLEQHHKTATAGPKILHAVGGPPDLRAN